jgi:hypothetical protein
MKWRSLFPGGEEGLAPALLHLQSQDKVFQALQPVLSEILDGMWVGESRAGAVSHRVLTRDDEEFGMG